MIFLAGQVFTALWQHASPDGVKSLAVNQRERAIPYTFMPLAQAMPRLALKTGWFWLMTNHQLVSSCTSMKTKASGRSPVTTPSRQQNGMSCCKRCLTMNSFHVNTKTIVGKWKTALRYIQKYSWECNCL